MGIVNTLGYYRIIITHHSSPRETSRLTDATRRTYLVSLREDHVDPVPHLASQYSVGALGRIAYMTCEAKLGNACQQCGHAAYCTLL